jgi:isopentenyl diphosphate isomerase/L-lactate dehydrogenase-like FMN-dependent dehydrogenase
LKAAAISTEQVGELIRLTRQQIRVSMFGTGAADLNALRNNALNKSI